jgi:DNA-binding protein H-NS
LGIAVPLFFSGNISKTKVAQLELQSWEQQKNEEQKIEQFIRQKKNELAKYQEAITYYNLEKSYRMKLLKWQIAVINKVKLTSFNTFKV